MRFFLAFLETNVLRIAQATSPLSATKIVAARTRYEPQAMWGTKSKTSTRKASRQIKKLRRPTIKTMRRYLAECDGEWKCATIDMMNMIRVTSAATGWMMRMVESVRLAWLGRSKLAFFSASAAAIDFRGQQGPDSIYQPKFREESYPSLRRSRSRWGYILRCC